MVTRWNGVPGTTFLERRSWNKRLFEWNGTGTEQKIGNWNGTGTEQKIGDWNGTGMEQKLETGTIWNGTIERYGTTFQVLSACIYVCMLCLCLSFDFLSVYLLGVVDMLI